MLEDFEQFNFNFFLNQLSPISVNKMYETLKSIFVKKFGEDGTIIAYLCSSSRFTRLNFMLTNNQLIKLKNYIETHLAEKNDLN